MSKVIFLDVDGVLNCCKGDHPTKERTPNGFIGIDQKYVKRLKKIVDNTGAYIVLTSDWKDLFRTDDCDPDQANIDGKYLCECLTKEGLKITERTDDKSVGNDFSTGRGYGIRKYLKNHPEVTDYIILDDVHFMDFSRDLEPHLILLTNSLTEKVVNKSINFLKPVDK